MELSKRKQAILSAIVKAYIDTGEPIGSKNLMALISNSPSSATLRNEMNELCALGLLAQPHTSAGRVPTESGYKVYVNSLMIPAAVLDSTKSFINSRLQSSLNESENLPQAAADSLSRLTGLPAFVSCAADKTVHLKQVQLLQVSSKSAVMVLIFSDGRTKSSLCHMPSGIDAELLSNFQSFVDTKVIKREIGDFSRADMQSSAAQFGINALALTPLLSRLYDMAFSAAESSIKLSGVDGIYNFCSETSAQKTLSLLNNSDALISLLDVLGDKQTLFGLDTNFQELKDMVFVTEKYFCKGKCIGRIGVIAPSRISYEQIIPSIRYTAERLSSALDVTAGWIE